MAFDDTFTTRLNKLFSDPKNSIKKVFPFVKSRTNPYLRHLVEFFGIYKFSQPYLGHRDLLNYLNFKGGFFVQCGGNDGYGNDPTYYLERALNWKGIIVEPLPIHKLCKVNRNRSVVYPFAAVSFDYTKTETTLVDCNAMSFIKGAIENEVEWIKQGERTQKISSRTITVPTNPLQKIIDNYFEKTNLKKIDLLVIDTEGYELEVLKGLNFDINSPTYLLLEVHSTKQLHLIANFLQKWQYSLVSEIGHKDFLFKHATQ